MPRAALIVVLAAAMLAACAAPTHIEGHRIRTTAESANDLHAEAPAWFEAWWGDYLRHARRGYAVLALDRNGQGGWYVFCGTTGCHVLDHVSVQSIRDVHYKYPALKRCREGIAKAGSAVSARLRHLCDQGQDRVAGPAALGERRRSRGAIRASHCGRRHARHIRPKFRARHARVLAREMARRLMPALCEGRT